MTSLPRFDFTVSPWVFDLLTHLWQSTVVAFGILLIVMWGTRLSARTRCTLGWIAVAKFFLPATWLIALVERASGAPKPWLASDALRLPMNLSPVAPIESASFASMPVTHLVAAVWIAGSAGLLACWIGRVIRVRRRILASAIPASDAMVQQVETAAAKAGLRVPPRCMLVASEYGPGLVGISAPVLILPRGLAEGLTSAELDSILVHECVHLQRRDNLWNAVRTVFVSVLWFNPLAWLLNRAIGIETEKSCDERVVELTGDADAYARSIVASVKHSLGMMRPGLSSVTTPPVLGRITAILAYPLRRERPMVRRAVLLASIGLVVLGGRAGSIAAETTKPAPTPPAPTAPAPTATAPASGDRASEAKPPRYKVGTVTIKFAGPANVSEQVVRDAMQIRAGGEFDEIILDRDIRAIYRTGLFNTIEIKHEPVDSTTFNLLVEVTPKSSATTSEPAPANSTNPTGPLNELTSTFPIVDEELNEARRKVDEASARLKKLRDERAAQKQKKESDDAIRAATSPPTPTPLNPRREIISRTPAASVQSAERQRPNPTYDISQLDRPPGARFQARPRYPFEMRRAGIAGEVIVDFIVSDTGDVLNAYAIRSSRPEFEAAAVEAVSKWKFRPGQKNGRDVHTHMQVPLVFTLNEN